MKPRLAKTALKNLAKAPIRKFAIAGPQHAPYGRITKRAAGNRPASDFAGYLETGPARAGQAGLGPDQGRGRHWLIHEDGSAGCRVS